MPTPFSIKPGAKCGGFQGKACSDSSSSSRLACPYVQVRRIAVQGIWKKRPEACFQVSCRCADVMASTIATIAFELRQESRRMTTERALTQRLFTANENASCAVSHECLGSVPTTVS